MAASPRALAVSDAVDEKNMLELGTAFPVATQQLLCSPTETREWVTLKEGYLLKTKFKKLRSSTKLRLFVLKQDPHTLEARLEYYEGKQLRGVADLYNARIHPDKGGVFLVHTAERTFFLQTEREDLKASVSWVLALQQAIQAAHRRAASLSAHAATAVAAAASAAAAAAAASGSPPQASSTAPNPTAAEGKRSTQAQEMAEFSNAIVEARWAALRKVMNPDVKVDESDEDVAFLREAEAAEERRQEHERQAWLTRQAILKMPALTEEDEEEVAAASSEEEEDMAETLRHVQLATGQVPRA